MPQNTSKTLGFKKIMINKSPPGGGKPYLARGLIDVLRQTACLVVNPIKVNNFAYLFDCTTE